MAGGFVGSDKGKRAAQYEGRITRYFVLTVIVASLGGSLFGYDLGVSGGVTSMDDFLKEFFPKVLKRKNQHLHETDYCKYDNQLLTLFTSSLYFAALLSTFGASHLTRAKGRRASILFAATSFFVGAVVNAAAVNIAMLIIGRIFLGIGIGFGNQSVPLYLSEMAPARHRGAVNQLFQFTTCFSIVVANIINYFTAELHPWGWRLSLGLAVVPASLMFLGGLMVPETPNSLVEQGRLQEAEAVLKKIRGTDNIAAEFADLVEASEAAHAVKHPFRNLFKRKNRPQLIIGAFGIPAFQQLTGNNSILFYAPVIFQSLGFGSGASLYSSILTSGMLAIAPFVSMMLVDRVGRRAMFIEAGCQMIIAMSIVAGVLAAKFGHGQMLPRADGIVLVIMTCLFCLAYGWSWGPLGWLVPSEIFPLETRSAGQSIVVCVNMFFTAAIAQCFLAALCHLRYGIFILFVCLIIIMTLFIIFLLPETKRVPIEEMHFLWESHPIWKNVVLTEQERLERGQQQD
ncbi:sugar transport protein 14-like isoform X1 [Aristolochia californica]|uniref:sugar transport protein 14-like isoform X1 n=1 Tax=Aristolochia californica TaxID=171875 RepID=UPI0035DC8B2E